MIPTIRSRSILRHVIACTVAALASGGTGCSALFVESHPGGEVVAPCTESSSYPALDTAAAVALGVGAIAVGLSSAGVQPEDGLGVVIQSTTREMAAGLGVAALAYTGSALYGFSATSTCRDLNARATLNTAARDAAGWRAD